MRSFRVAASAVLIVLVICSFCGCGKKKETPPPSGTTVAEVKEEKKAESAPVKQTASAEDYEEGSLKVKLSNSSADSDSGKDKKTEESSNVAIIRKETPPAAAAASAKPNLRKQKKTKKAELEQKLWTPNVSGTLASLLAPHNADKEIRWTPLWTDYGVGGVRIPDAVLSGDSSILVFLETTGPANGPFGTRLIVYDTNRWIVTALFQLDNNHAVSGCMIANTGRLALIVRGQEETQSDSLLIFDLQTGAVSDRVALDYTPSRLFANPSSGSLCVTERDSARVRIYNSGNLSEPPKQIKCGGANPAVAFSAHGDVLLMAAGKILEQYKTSDLRPLSSEKLPDGFVPWSLNVISASMVLIGPSKDQMSEALFVSNRSVRSFGENSGGQFLVPKNQGKHFFALMARKGEIVQYQLPGLGMIASVVPEDVSPKTVGDPFKIFWIPHANCIAVLDVGGYFYLLHRENNAKAKWNKKLIFAPKIN